MIVKMKFLNISGPRTDIDRVINDYLSKYEIQLEHAITELKTVDNLFPFLDVNPYKDPLAKVTHFIEFLSDPFVVPDTSLSDDEILDLIQMCNQEYIDLQEKKEILKKSQDELRDHLKIINPFKGLEFQLNEVLHFKYIKARYGRIPTEFYKKLEKYLYDSMGVIFTEGGRDANYIYGTYFVASAESFKTDATLKSMHFEAIDLPADAYGTPQEAISTLETRIEEAQQQLEKLDKDMTDIFETRAAKLAGAKLRLEDLSQNFDVRKLAARTKSEDQEEQYILCGWMSEEDANSLIQDTKKDDKVLVVVDEGRSKHFGAPPTKLNNPKLFKPFEMFIKMYGLPDHDEMDPTIFVALTYTFIFGIMFGDVGQGLCLVIGGTILYLTKKISLAGIIATAGVFSTFFGFMFGSVFGFEDIIEPIWISPISHMTTLPFIGKLNTVFIVAVAFGMALIILAMIFHIINAARSHDLGSMCFDPNGIAGLVFYGSAVAAIFLFMTGHTLPGGIVLAVMFVVPLLLIALKEPIVKKVQKRADKMEESKGMFLVQAFFELFETLLSYFSNTLSFVRIGAFAVSHAAMMQVVLMLAGVESGNTNWIIVVLGNLFVSGMEGLIVGIQVLRLEYYEMFSRFYKGSGREFKPYKKKNN